MEKTLCINDYSDLELNIIFNIFRLISWINHNLNFYSIGSILIIVVLITTNLFRNLNMDSLANRNYLVNNFLRSFKSSATKARYSMSTTNKICLDPHFITGFTDAEGSFMISILKSSERWTGWSVGARFEITLHLRDEDLLNQIQAYFQGVGKIYKYGKDKVVYRVNNLEQIITIIIPHFQNYPLNTNKWGDFELFKRVVMSMSQKEHLTKEGLHQIVAIRASMNLGLSEVLKASFPSCIPVPRPQLVINKNYHPQWIAGFTSGEGYFAVKILSSTTHKTGAQVKLVFQLTQHTRDELLLKSFEGYFGCGKYYLSKRAEYGDFQVGKFLDITQKIIPFFQNNKILGEKSKDFNDWCKVADLMKDGQHLSERGLEQIRVIKDHMNKSRY